MKSLLLFVFPALFGTVHSSLASHNRHTQHTSDPFYVPYQYSSFRPHSIAHPTHATSSHESSAPDPCRFTPGQIYTHSAVATCFQGFAFNETIRTDAMKHLQQLVDIYPYTDLAKAPPTHAAYGPAVDLKAGLARIEKKRYDCDFDFQMDVYQLLLGLNDGHTWYHPTCYREPFEFYQPFAFLPVSENHRPTLIVQTPDWWSSSERNYTSHPEFAKCLALTKEYENWEVVGIDDLAAFDAIRQFADQDVGGLRDREARYIDAMTAVPELSNHQWTVSPPKFFKRDYIPRNPIIRYTLLHPQTGYTESINIPWLGIFSSDTASTTRKEYWTQYCDPDSPIPKVSIPSYQSPPTQHIPHKNPITHNSLHTRQEKGNSPLTRLVDAETFTEDPNSAIINSVTAAVQLDKDTWVLNVMSFDDDQSNVVKWAPTWMEAFRTAAKAGMRNLVLDFTGNGGGYITESARLNRMLDPEYLPPQGAFPVTETVRKAIESGDGYYENFMGPTGISVSAAEVFNATSDLPIAGAEIPRSGRTILQDFGGAISVSVKNLPTPFNLAIVTNGNCVSACALITNALRTQHNTPIYTTSPIPLSPFSYSTHAASIRRETTGNLFTTTAIAGVAWYEFYMDDGQVQDFAYLPSDETVVVRAGGSLEGLVQARVESWREVARRAFYGI